MLKKFIEYFRSQRMFSRMGTVGGPGRRFFLFWKRRRSAWRDTPTQTMARKKSQNSMVNFTYLYFLFFLNLI